MSGPEAADHVERTVPHGGHLRALTGESIDRILADFRNWLENLRDPPPTSPPVDPISLQTLVAQFTALRQDVNLQTKAARAAVDQTNAALELLRPAEEPEDDERTRSFVKVLLDIYDALGIACRQMEKAKQSAVDLSEFPDVPTPSRPGFLARLFGAETIDASAWTARRKAFDESLANLRDRFAGVADGYAMSLRRIERAFPDLGLEPIPCLGEPFDPELMEVVDTVSSKDRPSGTVVEVLRDGFIRNERLFRHAHVKVAT